MKICYGCQRPIGRTGTRFRGEPVHRRFPACLPRNERLTCPECGSHDTVLVWDENRYTEAPDYLGCNECGMDMIRLKDHDTQRYNDSKVTR